MLPIPRLAASHIEHTLSSSKALILLGARQVGKTTLIKNILSEGQSTYLNLDFRLDQEKLAAASALPAEQVAPYFGHKAYLIIDEAQRWPATARLVKGWYDKEVPIKCILLGSAGLNILDKAAEALTGRNDKQFLTPLLLEECVKNETWYIDGIKLDSFQDTLAALRDRLLVLGGYPEVYQATEPVELLRGLYTDYLFKDLFGLEIVGSRAKFSKLVSLLAWQVGSEFAISELATQLGLGRQTVERYLELLEDTFVIFRLPAWSRNPRKELSKKQKIYFWDNGIRNAAIDIFTPLRARTDRGALWENFVVSEMMKRNVTLGLRERLYFWRSYEGGEVDLIVQKDQTLEAYEIKWRAQNLRVNAEFEQLYQAPIHLIHSDNYLDHLIAPPTVSPPQDA